jgi:hypothetical protein
VGALMLIGKLHELKKSEEGQTLVLAALFGLVLMMCVLGTVNLGRAVYDKVQLQAAADAEAYSTAAVEARVLNFTAYTNRAMVVHYASVMAATSYLTWVHFNWAWLRPVLSVLRMVPYVGIIFQVIQQVFTVLIAVLDYGITFLSPLLSAANVLLYGLQEGAWYSVWLRLARSIQPEAHSGDSAQMPYQPIWPQLIPAANQLVFSQTRGHLTMLQNSWETLGILYNNRNAAVQQARLHMLEVANSARQPWVAYGDRYNNPTISPLGRHFQLFGLKLGPVGIAMGAVARTEMNGYQPRGGIIGGARTAFPQVWSGQRLQFTFKLGPLKWQPNLFSFIAMDQLYTPFPRYFENSYYLLLGAPKWLKKVLPVIGRVLDGIARAARSSAPRPDYRPFWMSPYVYFAPRAHSAAGPGPTGALGNFAQPDVVSGLALEGRFYNRELGATKYYGRRFSWNGKGAGRGAVDFSYTNQDWPRLPGGIPFIRRGLNAFSAAQVYYHRPGDWKEQPNFFNPLWGARLMPVKESNSWAKLPLRNVPLLGQYLLH